jgi:methylmalonyl-CoA mutase cobalamin-binding subunit
LDSLLSASPAPSRNQTIMVGCPPGEWHTFTPLLLSLLLRRRGFHVVYLGANVPAENFEEAVKTVNSKLIILAAQTLISASALKTTAQALGNLQIPIGYGGRIFNLLPDVKNRIPGHYLGDSIPASINTTETLLQTRTKPSPPIHLSQEYLDAHQAFVAERSYIEGKVMGLSRPLSIKPEEMKTGLEFLGDNIVAALQLGSMEYLNDEVSWLKTLFENHQRTLQKPSDFMKTYSQAVDEHIDGRGAPIKTWLNAQAVI